MLGVHLYVEFEADSALPLLHEFGELTPTVLSITQTLLVLLDLSRGEEHGGVGG